MGTETHRVGHSRRRSWKVRIASGFVASVNAVWFAINSTITAANLPSDAGQAWETIVSAPEYIPAGIVLVSLGILAWSLWPSRKPETALLEPARAPDPHAAIRQDIERARLEAERADALASLEFRRGLNSYVRGEPRAHPHFRKPKIQLSPRCSALSTATLKRRWWRS